MSGVWTRLFMAVKGGVNETAEAVADNQAVRIMDQEIRDAEKSLSKAQTDLASLMGKRRLSEKRVAEFRDKLMRDEQVVVKAMEQGREDLAEELANRMATVEGELHREEGSLQQIMQSEQQLKNVVQTTKTKLESLKREVETVKVTESVQKAQSAIASQSAGVSSKMGNAMSSLERIKERQAARSAQMEASAELEALQSGSDLDRRLAAAGVTDGGSSGSAILARIKAQNAPALPGGSSAAIEGPKSD